MDVFDDFFGQDEFLIDPEAESITQPESWDSGVPSDIFATGETPDIFTTKECQLGSE